VEKEEAGDGDGCRARPALRILHQSGIVPPTHSGQVPVSRRVYYYAVSRPVSR